MGGYAWVTLATNDSYSLGALVLAHSLKKSNTAHKLAVLITPAVSEPMRDQLQTVFDVVKTVDVLDSKDEAHLALMKRPELGITFTKIHCWRLTEFEKCVFLDADTLVVRNCDELFEREEFSAAPDVSWPDCFNSGVFVYKPSVETFNKLLQFAVEKGSFDGGDQGLLNQFFSDWATEDIKKHLPFVYNLTSVAAYSYIPAFKQYGAETRIVHFIGTGKPWLQQLDPATRTITPTSGSEHLAPLLQQWWDLFCEKVHPNLSKNLDNNNDGMSHPPVEACSNTPVALTSDEPQSPRLIEPCLQYREKDDYRQHNLPYQPFDVRGSSGELLNVEFLMASVVSPKESGEQEKPDVKELEEKVTKTEVQKEPSHIEQTKPEIIDDKVEEKQEKPPTPKDPFDYNTFFPDEKCVNNYLEQNVITYQPFEAPREEPQPETIPLPRFLTMPEDDQRQKGNIEVAERQPSPEPPPPPPAPPATPEKLAEIERPPTPPPVEKHELPKSKSMTFIPGDIIAADIPPAPPRSIWKSQPNVNVDLNRKYSMPKLKPLLPRQNSKSIQSPVPRVTLYTEFVMSADYKDPIDLPKDKVGFVETELRRSKSEADLKGKFGPLPFTRSPEVEIPEPKKPPLRELDNDAYDLSRCKRQLGNKPRDYKKENIMSKLITPSKDKKSTLIKKRKSKELSPGDGAKEKPLKRERKERQRYKKNENVDEILKRLWEFSKNYQHFFGVEEQNGAKPRPIQSEFKQFRNFVKDQKETTQKGLLGIQDLMSTAEGTKVRNENVTCVTDPEVIKVVNGLDKDGKTRVTPNGEGKVQARVENVKKLSQSPRRGKVIKEKHVELTNNANSENERTSENIPNGHNGIELSNEKSDKKASNLENKEEKIADSNNETILTNNIINQNGCTGPIDGAASQQSVKTTKAREAVTQIEKNENSISETPSNGCSIPPKSSIKSPVSEDIPGKTRKDEKQATDVTTNSEPELSSTSLSKQPEKRTEDSLDELNSQTLTITVPTVQTQNEDSSKLEEETEKNTQLIVTQINVESSMPEKEKEEIKTKELCQEKTEPVSEPILEDPQPQSYSLDSSERHVINGECNGEINTAGLVNNTQLEKKNEEESQRPSGNVIIVEEETAGSDVNKVTRAEIKEDTLEMKNASERSDKRIADEAIPQEKSSLTTPVEESTPKGMFTIGSPEKSTEVDEKNNTHTSTDIVSSQTLKQTEKVPLKSKTGSSIPKPDEILCVPDFDTPRSSRILTPVPKPNTGATPLPPPSSEIATLRKARIQRKPYENGTKYRSPVGKRTIKTGNTKHSAGIAGAIAQLNLEAGGKAVDGGATSAAHQEYIRRQNWETGNMDYMGRDSFENIWSKICQTLEGKELDKSTESTQSPVTISTEEKTQPERAAGTGAPVSLSTILQKCPEFIDTLPSEPITGPVEDDEIIFSKPEIKQKSLTNITEEEENGGAAEEGSVKLSDILKPQEMTKPSGVSTQQTTATPESKLPEQAKTEEKSQAVDSSASQVQKGTAAAVPPKQENEQTKPGPEPQTLTVGPVAIQPDETIKPPPSGNSECTTVAIRQPISIPGAPCEDQTKTPAKTPAEKIAEKKLQQKPETSTEPIPLPAPESPTQPECKTVAIPYPPTVAAPVKETSEPLEVEGKTSSKDEKQKKGVFSKLLEMVGVTPKVEEGSKSVFYDAEKTEGSEKTEPTDLQGGNKESQAELPEGERKEQAPTKPQITPEVKPDSGVGVSEQSVVGDGVQISMAETKQEAKSSVPETGIPAPDLKPSGEGEGKLPGSGTDKIGSKLGQAPMPKPARNASPKPPSPLTIPQTPPDTALTVATPTPPPEPPKRRNSALLKVDESIPATPPVPEPQKESAEPVKSEVENILEKAKTEVESILLGRRSSEKEVTESTDLINTMKLMVGAEAEEAKPKAEELEELKVTSEEERQRHKGEVASSKLSDQILKAIPPPRRKAISESKSEASGSSGAIPKTPAPAGEKPKGKPSSIPVPPPRNKGKPSTPAPPKGKTKK